LKVALFVGGRGTRLSAEESAIPKALFQIGDRPIVWHIMRMFMAAGMNDFVLLLGYRGDLIADYFIHHAPYLNADVEVSGGRAGLHEVKILARRDNPWKVTLCPTGTDTEKGERLRRARKYLEEEPDFVATYGDGLADINPQALADFHRAHGKMATVTAVRVCSQWGHLDLDDGGRVTGLHEKPPLPGWVNGGFFVFRREVLDLLEQDDTLESNCLPRLAAAGELMAYRHEGFWTAMDTYKDNLALNQMWESGHAPWQTWSEPATD
jgi:glucose-1-phosphate cytidylyltransferase